MNTQHTHTHTHTRTHTHTHTPYHQYRDEQLLRNENHPSVVLVYPGVIRVGSYPDGARDM